MTTDPKNFSVVVAYAQSKPEPTGAETPVEATAEANSYWAFNTLRAGPPTPPVYDDQQLNPGPVSFFPYPVRDPNNLPLTFSLVTPLPASLQIDPATGEIYGTLDALDWGITTCQVRVSNGTFTVTGPVFRLYYYMTGGVETRSTIYGIEYALHSFEYDSFQLGDQTIFPITVGRDIPYLEFLVVGGGGGGGADRGGGGGAGGIAIGDTSLSIGQYTTTVGAGGAPATAGYSSSFGSVSVLGGGRGGGSAPISVSLGGGYGPTVGGSGGGGSTTGTVITSINNFGQITGTRSVDYYVGADATAGQGSSGGSGPAYSSWDSNSVNGGGGGGGGAATRGGNGGTSQIGGVGGDGIFIPFLSAYIGGGGAGGSRFNNAAGGLGGGGSFLTNINGTDGTGGGGAGGKSGAGGSGGRGRVLLRYPLYAQPSGVRRFGLVQWLDAADYTSGITWEDSIGGYDATLFNAPSKDSDGGGTFVFDGTTQYARYNTPLELNPLASFTIETWVKWTTTGSTSSSIQTLLDNSYTTASPSFLLQDRPDLSSNALSFEYTQTSGTTTLNTSEKVGDGTWHHVAIVANFATPTVRIYIDSALAGEVSSPSAASRVLKSLTTIGRWEEGVSLSTPRYFNGRMAILRTYARALSYDDLVNNFLVEALRFGNAPEKAYGGTVQTIVIGNTTYKTHTFLSSSFISGQAAFTFSVLETLSSLDYLVIGGGGGGGANGGGGGGGGGVLTGTMSLPAGYYNAIIGAGGTAGSAFVAGGNGYNTTFDSVIAIGGGGGASRDGGNVAGTGGSGGGGAGAILAARAVGGSGTAGQGNDGGDGTADLSADSAGAGGGGAGAVGTDGAFVGAGLFEGTGDFLNYSAQSAFAMGTGNFTIETWVYFTSLSTTSIIYDGRPLGSTGANQTLYATSTTLRWYTNGADRFNFSITWSTSTWYHLTVSRSSGSTSFFINGVLVGSISDSTNYTIGTNRPVVGGNGNANSSHLIGYLRDFRVTKGIGRYTSNFVPPESLPVGGADPDFANVSLLLPMSSNFDDASNNAFVATVNGDARVSGISAAGNGGNGSASSVTGLATYYAGGGGGGLTQNGNAGSGGLGGGGAGSASLATAGTSSLGGGGGGGALSGAVGGSGAIVLRYPTGSASPVIDPNQATAVLLIPGLGWANATATNWRDFSNYPTTYAPETALTLSGTGGYLGVDATSALAFGTEDFTIEGWAWLTGSVATGQVLFDTRPPSTQGLFPLLYVNSSTQVAYNVSSADRITASVSLNYWNHVAVVRKSGRTEMFLNGEPAGFFEDTNSYATGNVVTIGASSNAPGASSANGSLSNFRITKGVARYDSTTITVPTMELPDRAAATAGDVDFGSVSLLLRAASPVGSTTFVDSSNNGFAITRNGTPVVSALSPFTDTGSISFNGSADFLTIPDSDLFLLTSDFTIEAWVYPTAAPSASGGSIIAHWTPGSATQCSFIFYLWTGNRIGFSWGIGGVNTGFQGTSTTFPLNQWSHVAVTRSGSTVRLYVNGVQDATTGTASGSLNDAPGLVQIGRVSATDGGYLNGLLTNLRVTKGIARYTATFTPPTASFPTTTAPAPADPSFGATWALLRGDGQNNGTNFVDLGPSTRTLTRTGTVVTSTAQSKWGGSSLFFNGATTGNYLTGPSLSIGASDFTIECWFYIAGQPPLDGQTTRKMVICSCTAGANSNWALGVNGNITTTGTGLFFLLNGNAFYSTADLLYTGTIPLGTWHHVAVSRRGSARRMFFNGALVAANMTSVSLVGAALNIGRAAIGSYERPFNGYIDDLRVTLAGRYVGGFTPPQQYPTGGADPDFANVSLLLPMAEPVGSQDFVDVSNNNLPVTTVGGAASAPRSIGSWTTAVQKNYGGAIYFDGTTASSLRTLPSDTGVFGSDDFTVEFWFRSDLATSANRGLFGGQGYTLASSTSFAVFHFGTELRLVRGTASSSTTVVTATGIEANTWYYVAVERTAGLLHMFVNGLLVGSAVDTNIYLDRVFEIGRVGSSALTGYMQDIRAYRTAKYALTDPYFGLNTLLLHCEGSNGSTAFTDSSLLNATVTANGNTQISTSRSKFGSSSALFDGAGDYLSWSGTSFAASDDFTVEAWVYKTSVDASGYTVLFYGSGNTQFSFDNTTAGSISLVINGSVVIAASGTAVTPNNWHHLAWTRQGTTVRAFVNGVLMGSGTSSAAFSISEIGRYGISPFGYEMNGNLDDIRVTKGYARYTANFTPPTEQFSDRPVFSPPKAMVT